MARHSRICDDGAAPASGTQGARPNGCLALVALAEREALAGRTPRELIRRLALTGAGVRPGLAGIVDLARAGRDGLPGRGFRPELCDATDGQARHFCGVADCCARFGAKPTRWVSIHLRRDPPDEPDGRLTDLAIEFATLLRRGELAVADAPAWLRRALCAPVADDGRASPSVHA